MQYSTTLLASSSSNIALSSANRVYPRICRNLRATGGKFHRGNFNAMGQRATGGKFHRGNINAMGKSSIRNNKVVKKDVLYNKNTNSIIVNYTKATSLPIICLSIDALYLVRYCIIVFRISST